MGVKTVLKLGVTGRRHIVPEALSEVALSMRTLFYALVEKFNGTIELYTGLAVGADQLAAEIAFEAREKFPGADVRVIGVLPASLERYERDFKTTHGADGTSQLDGFRALLRRCDEVVDLGVPEVDTVDKTACYSRLGYWLVERCPNMIAFWNGDKTIRKPGGTVDVALLKASRCGHDGGFLCCISTPEMRRKKAPDGTKIYVPDPVEDAGKIAVLRDEPTDEIAFLTREEGIDAILASI